GSGPWGGQPAELMSVLSTVNLATTWSTIRSHALASVTSVSIANASPPAALITRAVSFARSPIRSTHATRAPSAASRFAVAAPIPEPAPVISATFPRILPAMTLLAAEDTIGPSTTPEGAVNGFRVLEEDEDVLGADHRLHEQVHLSERARLPRAARLRSDALADPAHHGAAEGAGPRARPLEPVPAREPPWRRPHQSRVRAALRAD